LSTCIRKNAPGLILSCLLISAVFQAPLAAALTLPPDGPVDSSTISSADAANRQPQASTADTGEDLTYLGHTGGATYAVAVEGDYAYIGEGASLAVLDISTPSAPRVEGRSALFPRPNDIGLVEPASDVCVGGSHAYVAENGRLRTYDVSLPSEPVEVASLDTPGTALGVAVAGDIVYVADGTEGLRVIDVSDPSNPEEVGSCPLVGSAKAVDVYGSYAYVTNGYGGLYVVNVTNSTSPSQVGEIDTAGPADDVDVAAGSTPGKTYAYVAAQHEGLRVIDVTNPISPTEVGFNWTDVPMARGVDVRGDYAYVASGTGLVILDISSPATPTLVGSDSAGAAWGVAVAPGTTPDKVYAYVAHVQEAFRVVDVSTPASPTDVGEYDPPAWGGAIAVRENGGTIHAYVGGSWELPVVDVTNPSVPRTAGAYDTPSLVNGVDVYDGHVYVAAGDALRILDVTDPVSPSLVAAYDTPGWAQDVVVQPYPPNVYAYVADGTAGLTVLNVTDPENPTAGGSYDTAGNEAYGVTLAENEVTGHTYAYVCAGGAGLRILDVTLPTAPVEVGYEPVNGFGSVRAVAIAAGPAPGEAYAYVAQNLTSLALVDVSDPTDPTGIDRLFSPLWVYDVAVKPADASGRSYAYVGHAHGVSVLDVTSPMTPTTAAYYETPRGAEGVTVTPGGTVGVSTLYVGIGNNGLAILRHTGTVPESDVSGRITSANGLPVAGVTVSAHSASDTTDSSGSYALEDLPPGTYRVIPELTGYRFLPSSREVTLPPDAAGEDFTIVSPPVSATLTAEAAGELVSVDTQSLTTTVVLPAGAVSGPTTLVLTPTTATGSAELAFAGHAFDLEAYQGGVLQPDFAFGHPVTVTIRYSQADTGKISNPSQLKLYWWDGSLWQDAAQTCAPASVIVHDEVHRVISVPICHLSRFALLGPVHRIYLPLVLRGS